MFGDVGHGSCLVIMGLLLYFKPSLFSEDLLRVRSLLLVMGLFSTYCGLIYNDFLSIPIPLFKSCYEGINKPEKCSYQFGIDYTWHLSANSITFINSFKMKISIVIGVIHMIIGITLKGLNALHFKRFAEFFFEFLPQIIFFISTFGYMVFCIFAKWMIDFHDDPSLAPSIITLYINFV